jgi:2-dehydropantoate 2-reductase
MRHAVLGVGGVGGLIGGALARAGREVLLVLRPESLAAYPGGVHVESALLGEFDVDVPAASRLDRDVDVLWIAVKATQLADALEVAAPAVAPNALVVPLLNGIDHVAPLREQFGELVVPGAIRVESERVGPAHVRQASPFASIDLAPPPALLARAEELAAEVREAGLACQVRAGETAEADVLWGKLALLAPFALATSGAGRPIGEVRTDAELRELMLGCAREVCAVAAAAGARLDPEIYVQALLGMPDEMRSSMQKDVSAGRPPELDAIAGPILRLGRSFGIPTPATEELARRVGQAQAV